MLFKANKNNHKFFENVNCKYYPCHEGLEETNCLFCFCPLYSVFDCGGNFTMFNGHKDCSECVFPHMRMSYDMILEIVEETINAPRREYQRDTYRGYEE